MIIRSPRLNKPDSFKNVLDVIDLSVCTGQLNVPSLSILVLQGWSGLHRDKCVSFLLLLFLLSFSIPFPPFPSSLIDSALPLFTRSTNIPFTVASY